MIVGFTKLCQIKRNDSQATKNHRFLGSLVDPRYSTEPLKNTGGDNGWCFARHVVFGLYLTLADTNLVCLRVSIISRLFLGNMHICLEYMINYLGYSSLISVVLRWIMAFKVIRSSILDRSEALRPAVWSPDEPWRQTTGFGSVSQVGVAQNWGWRMKSSPISRAMDLMDPTMAALLLLDPLVLSDPLAPAMLVNIRRGSACWLLGHARARGFVQFCSGCLRGLIFLPIIPKN